MKDFRDLQVWNKAHALTLNIYATTRRFPKEELYGLTSQIRSSRGICVSSMKQITDAWSETLSK